VYYEAYSYVGAGLLMAPHPGVYFCWLFATLLSYCILLQKVF
jgi:hypothetical protein